MKALPLILGIIIVALLGVLIFVPAKKGGAPTENATSTPSVTTSTPGNATSTDSGTEPAMFSYTSKKGKTIKAEISPNEEIELGTTFSFDGNVPAGWAFEANFPVKILDANGHTIGQGTATVPNWMSATGAWFRATVTIMNRPDTATGFILIHNDNASGLPENDDEVRIPVRFR